MQPAADRFPGEPTYSELMPRVCVFYEGLKSPLGGGAS